MVLGIGRAFYHRKKECVSRILSLSITVVQCNSNKGLEKCEV